MRLSRHGVMINTGGRRPIVVALYSPCGRQLRRARGGEACGAASRSLVVRSGRACGRCTSETSRPGCLQTRCHDLVRIPVPAPGSKAAKRRGRAGFPAASLKGNHAGQWSVRVNRQLARIAPVRGPRGRRTLGRANPRNVGCSVAETAGRQGCERGTPSRLLSGKAGVSAKMALTLEDLGWGTAEHWMRMQASDDLGAGTARTYVHRTACGYKIRMMNANMPPRGQSVPRGHRHLSGERKRAQLLHRAAPTVALLVVAVAACTSHRGAQARAADESGLTEADRAVLRKAAHLARAAEHIDQASSGRGFTDELPDPQLGSAVRARLPRGK